MKYAPAVGVKFEKNGQVKEFKGNTFLCHISTNETQLLAEIKWGQDQLKAMNCAYKFAFLPITSMHMTVFEGVCENIRQQPLWTNKLSLDAPLSAVTDLFINELTSMPRLGYFEMDFHSIYNCPIGGTAIRIKPATAASRESLWQCRTLLSQATGIKHPNHDDYHFHISLSYRIIELDEHDKTEILVTTDRITERLSAKFGRFNHGPVEFCHFNDMFKYSPLTVLDSGY